MHPISSLKPTPQRLPQLYKPNLPALITIDLERYLKLDDVYVDFIREITAERALRTVVESSIEWESAHCFFRPGRFRRKLP